MQGKLETNAANNWKSLKCEVAVRCLLYLHFLFAIDTNKVGFLYISWSSREQFVYFHNEIHNKNKIHGSLINTGTKLVLNKRNKWKHTYIKTNFKLDHKDL
jgi:hypothetical protein